MTGEETPRPHSDVRRYRRYVEQELDDVVLYRQFAERADGEHRTVLLDLADVEERHARYWQQKLAELGAASGDVATHRPTSEARLLSWLAGRLGLRTIVPLLERMEASERGRYGREPDAAGRPMVRSGLRQLLIGSLTAAGTYLVGLGFGGVIA